LLPKYGKLHINTITSGEIVIHLNIPSWSFLYFPVAAAVHTGIPNVKPELVQANVTGNVCVDANVVNTVVVVVRDLVTTSFCRAMILARFSCS